MYVFINFRLCPFHAKQSLMKAKPPLCKKKIAKGPKALLRSLEHYCKSPLHDPEYKKEKGIAEEYEAAPCETQCPASLRSPSMNFYIIFTFIL